MLVSIAGEEGSISWPYRDGGCLLRMFFRILLVEARVLDWLELPPRVEERLGAMISVVDISG